MIGRDFLYSIHKDKKSIYFVKIKASLIVKVFMKNFIN